MGTLLRLHAARWEDASAAFEPELEAFHREFAAVALERGWLRLWICEVDGSPVAAWYGLRYAGCECFYQSGRDPAWDEHSVGFVLLAHTHPLRLRGRDARVPLPARRRRLQGALRRRRPGSGDDGRSAAARSAGPPWPPPARSGACPRGDRLLARANSG